MELLSIQNLHIHYKTLAGIVRAVERINLTAGKGESLGLIGESGCGKSTLGMSLLGLLPSSAYIPSGRIIFKETDLTQLPESEMRKIRGDKISLVFQGAMNAFNPVKRLSNQIAEGILLHRRSWTWSQALDRVAALFEAVGIEPSRIHEYPHQFSGGMKQRAMIAMALSCDPEIIIADEPVTALDVMNQAKILELLKSLSRDFNLCLILITHDLSVVAEVCDRIAVMYGGKLMEITQASDIYRHPYTRRLFKAFPNIEGQRDMDWGIPGTPPDLISPHPGCRFAPRCDQRMEICSLTEPELVQDASGHSLSCHLKRRHEEPAQR